MKKVILGIASIIIFSSCLPASAESTQSGSLSASAPSVLSSSDSGCTQFVVRYKINKSIIDYPSFVTFILAETNDFNPERVFAISGIDYNINPRTGEWEDNGEPAAGTIPLEFCEKSKTHASGETLQGLTKSGTYWVQARILVVKTKTSDRWEDLYIPIKITVSRSTINCTKGNMTKKVTGKNPQCPAGYKKK